MEIFIPRLHIVRVDEMLRPRSYWLSRLIIAVLVMMNCLAVIAEPRTLLAQIIKASGPLGMPVIWLLLGLAAVALCDVLINDLLPERFTMRWALDSRHVVYHVLAIILVALAMVVVLYSTFTPLLWIMYLAYAAFSFAIAWLDLFSRPRVKQ